MSEIKGQLLGIVLVVAVFGAVGTILVSAFKQSATNLKAKIETDTEPTAASVDNLIVSNDELLTF